MVQIVIALVVVGVRHSSAFFEVLSVALLGRSKSCPNEVRIRMFLKMLNLGFTARFRFYLVCA